MTSADGSPRRASPKAADHPCTCHPRGSWDVRHRDPIDRMLAAQSSLEDLRWISRDAIFAEFGLEPIW
jgi:PIN domain nuclease of toxin-antitoxin system